jgi:hypothetical protein
MMKGRRKEEDSIEEEWERGRGKEEKRSRGEKMERRA